MAQEEPCRNKGSVRLVAFLDMVLSLILFAFYTGAVIATKGPLFKVKYGPFSKIAMIIISVIMWAIAFGFTCLQLVTAYRLFLVTFQDHLGHHAKVQETLRWLRVTALLFAFIFFKMIYSYLRYPQLSWLFWTLCIMEIAFRVISLYFAREFYDDMKHHIHITIVPPTTVKSSRNSKFVVTRPEVIADNHIDTTNV